MPITLRDYQQKGVAEIRAAMATSKRVLYQLPTGGGKTRCFAYVTNGAVRKQKRVYILAHRAEILKQISAAIGDYDLPHGWIMPGRTPTNDICQVGMIQTVARRIERLPPPDICILDEAHHVVSPTFKSVLDRWPETYMLGVTATPQRLDGRGLGEVFQFLITGPQSAELIERGFLAQFSYLAPELAKFDGVKTRMGDYVSDAIAELMDKPTITGSAIGHYKKFLDGKTAIAFCVTVAHSEHVAGQFRDAGIPALSIDGKMHAFQRTAILDALRSGQIKVLTSCELISEGFDCPSVHGAILLRPTKSLAMYLQTVGRVLRPKEDGSKAIILDHVANYQRHGMPATPRKWTLAGKIKSDFTTKKCEACFRVFEVTKGWKEAAECGDEGNLDCILDEQEGGEKDRAPGDRGIAEVEGQLTEISESPAWLGGINIARASGAEYKAMIDKADTYEKLKLITAIRGYKRGWARWVLKSREPKK